MKLRYIFSIFLIYFTSVSAYSQEGCKIQSYPFQAGESLTYAISYNWFVVFTDVGYAHMQVKPDTLLGRPFLQLDGRGTSTPSWDKFFKVRDRYQSWVHPETLLPVFFKRDVNEGDYSLDITYNFYQQQRKVKSYRRVKQKAPKYDTLDIKDCTFDVVSSLYYARTIDYTQLKPMDTVSLNLLLDVELIPFYFRYLGTETIKLKELGEIECNKFAVMVVEGSVFSEDGERLYVWISNDENKIPVYAESPIVIGKVKVRLLEYQNLKYPIHFR